MTTMNYKPLTYLTCPYSHPDPAVSEARFEAVTKAAAWLMAETGWNVFSPITHSHPMHALAGLRGDWPFWKKIDTEYLECSCRVVNFVIPGWSDSTGVTEENQIAAAMGLEVLYLEPCGPNHYTLTTVRPETKYVYAQ